MALTCAIAFIVASAPVAPAAEPRVPLAGTAYNPLYEFTDTGPAATGTTVSDNIYLSVRDPSALAAQAKSVSAPGSPGYGRYISSGQNQTDNQLDPAQVARIRDWLSSAGLTVSQPNWRTLRVTGTVGQFADAFDVTFHDYHLPPGADYPYHFLIPTTDLSVPTGLGRLVLGVETSTFVRHTTAGNATADAGSATARPADLGGVTYPHVTGTASAGRSSCSRY